MEWSAQKKRKIEIIKPASCANKTKKKPKRKSHSETKKKQLYTQTVCRRIHGLLLYRTRREKKTLKKHNKSYLSLKITPFLCYCKKNEKRSRTKSSYPLFRKLFFSSPLSLLSWYQEGCAHTYTFVYSVLRLYLINT